MIRDSDVVLYDLFRDDAGRLPDGVEMPTKAEAQQSLATWKALGYAAQLRRMAERALQFTMPAALEFLGWCHWEAGDYVEDMPSDDLH